MLNNKIIAITRDSIHSHEFIKLMQNEDAIPFMLPTIKIIKRNTLMKYGKLFQSICYIKVI